jgi:hypothetical protein
MLRSFVVVLAAAFGAIAIHLDDARPAPWVVVSSDAADNIFGGDETTHNLAFGSTTTTRCAGNYGSCDTNKACGEREQVNLSGTGTYGDDGPTDCAATMCNMEKAYCGGDDRAYNCPS